MNTCKIINLVFIIVFLPYCLHAQQKNKSHLNYIGKIKPRHAREIQSSKISIGAEMMDRDYTVYANWKEYLGPLGAKKARIQSGWAKCEKEPAVYDWAWLDEIIYDMVNQGLEPWIDLCYGNQIYQGGGGTTLQQKALPDSEEALIGWEKYVNAIVNRYKQYVDEWEIWNEPNYGIDPEQFGRFVIRTAKAIKAVQSDATVIGMALGSGVDYVFADKVLAEIKNQNAIHLIDQIAYHRHIIVPESNDAEIELERVIDRYSLNITTRQGEAGCPSHFSESFAMNNMEWSDIQQSKHILRRLMCDLGRGKETNIFTIIDALYTSEGKATWNYKGLIAANKDLKVNYIKPAYYAMQNVTSIFDFALQPISCLPYESSDDENLYVFAHQNIYSGKQLVTVWKGNDKPTSSIEKQLISLKIYKGNFQEPVYVDLLTGEVYEIPEKNWSKRGTAYSFKNIPVYDSPILVTDKSNILIME